ncbi:MAG: glycosyltransferase [Bacteroidales bacterium]|nr:glycosyltransferase [Bacteroidales bacterium]
MIRLLIVLPSYRWGGDATALYNLLNRLDTNRFKVDLFPLIDEGPYRERYSNCSLLGSSGVLEALLKRNQGPVWRRSLPSIVLKTVNRLSHGRFLTAAYRRIGRRLTRNTKYDAVIAWTEWDPTAFVAQIPHKYKVAWIHCDYTFNRHAVDDIENYRRMDRIVLVSSFCREQFLGFYPEFEDKVYVSHNILNVPVILEKSKEPIGDFPVGTGFNILSFGRIAPGKRFSQIPRIAASVRQAGIPFHWTIMGPDQHPDELALIREKIDEYKVQDCVEYIGVRSNPYPYIKAADLVVNTSASESQSLALVEASLLGTPTINADFKVAYEVIVDGRDGLIVPLEEIADTIVRFFKDEGLRNALRDNLKSFHYSDKEALSDFEKLFA